VSLHTLIQTHLLKRSALSYLLYPLGQAYASIQTLRRKLLLSKSYHAPCKVISIGNIVSGGSGKTPLTIAIARLLVDIGFRVAVSHRGYKGRFENDPHLISNSKAVLYSAEEAGDEAYLIATSLPGVPVVVGRKRKAAIRLLLKRFPATQVVLMDDAFQHIQVFRDLDIVSFSAETGMGNGYVIPAGYLRERLSALDANCVAVIYRMQESKIAMAWEEAVAAKVQNLFFSHSSTTECIDAKGLRYNLDSLKGKRLVLVSGIAQPKSFEIVVKAKGLSFSRHYAYPDHYSFDGNDITAKLLQEMPEIILCTQKDIMKLAHHAEIESRLRALVLDYSFDDQDGVNKLLSDCLIS
jgi:tetraacyldisaccharide 4'-kinase